MNRLRIVFGLILLAGFTSVVERELSAQEKAENPIGKFFRNLNKDVREGAEEIAKAQQGRDQLDARPPQKHDLLRKYDQGQEFLKQQRWNDAVSVFQFLLETEADSFFFNEDLELQSLRAEVQRRIHSLPADAERDYVNRYKAVADRRLKLAQQVGDLAELRTVADQYSPTVSGKRASLILAMSLRDQGNLSSASRVFFELARNTNSVRERNRLVRLAARLAQEAGDLAGFARLEKEFQISLNADTDQSAAALAPFSITSTQLLEANAPPGSGIDPKLVPLWTEAAVDRFRTEDQISRLYGDLEEANRAIILTGQCLSHGNLIAYHTLNGLEVRNTESGQLVWSHRPQNTIESVLLDPASRNLSEAVYRGRVPEEHPMVSLLLRDSVSRSLTTDGRHLFAIENQKLLVSPQQGYSFRRRMVAETPDNEQLTTNQIVAYDFETGRVRWRLGGGRLEAPFSRPLAGTFFFGPPVSDGTDLYVIGERDEVISLYVLNPQTGEVNWSQEIAHPSRSLAHDQVRRFWPCYPTIHNGMIICPTTCGWLVAIDQATHQLAWASRFTPRKKVKKTRAFVIQSTEDLNRRWLPTPPAVWKNQVIFTPPDLPNEFDRDVLAVYAFDLVTGQVLWQQEKGDGLYLAGLFEDQAIFVGTSQVLARDLNKNGEIAWKASFRDVTGKPSGRSVIVGEELIVPINRESLVRLNLRTGKQVAQHHLSSSAVKLGNLFYADEMLFSQATFHTAAFPIQELTQNKEGTPESFLTQFVRIEFLISNKQFEQALDAIQDVRVMSFYQDTTEDQREQLESLEWDCMEYLALQEDDLADEMLFTMETLASKPREIARYRRLAAEKEIESGHWKSAVRHLLTLLRHADHELFFTNRDVVVRSDLWVAGRLQDLYLELEDAERIEFEEYVLREQPSLRQLISLERLARILSFLPQGLKLEFELAETAEAEGRLTEALLRWQRVTHSRDRSQAAHAWLRIAKLLHTAGAVEDARRSFDKLLQYDAIETEDGNTHAVAETLSKQLPEAPEMEEPVSWGKEWEAFRTGSQGRQQSVKVVTALGEPFEFLRDYEYQYETNHQRLFLEQRDRIDETWSVPLRSLPNMSRRSHVGLLQTGAVSYAVHLGALHALHPLDQDVAWTYLPAVTGSPLSRLRSPSTRSTSVINRVNSYRNFKKLNSYSTPFGFLLDANERCVLTIDEALHALDPLTGELLWSLKEVNRRTIARLVDDRVLLCDNETTRQLRIADGTEIEEKLLDSFQEKCIGIAQNRCQYLIEQDDNSWILSQGSLTDPTADWQLPISSESSLVELDEITIGQVTANGQLSLIDMQSGQQKLLGFLPGDLMKLRKRLYAYADQENVYVMIAHGEGRTSYMSLPSLRASGTLICFSREGELLWSQNTEQLAKDYSHQAPKDEMDEEATNAKPKNKTVWSMNLIVEDLQQSPLLLLISDRPEHRDKIYFRRLTMVGLDKQTGQPVFDWYRISNSGGFSYLHVDTRDRYIDMRTYNERLRIQPVTRQQAAQTEVGQ